MDLMEPWDPLDHPPRIEIRRQDSDDSDAEGGLGNVTRVVLRPPGHSGKAKRGHLSFDASFETGNLGRVDFISEFEYDLFIRPDTCNPRYRLWFNFVVDNVRADQRVIFNIVNLSKPRNLFSSGMTPLVKTTSRPRWQRLGDRYVYYHKSPEHRNHYILSFAFVFDREDDVYQFALTFPYSYARLDLHLTFLLEKNLPWLTVQTLAKSLQSREVRIYTICNPSILDKKPKTVVLMSRIHAGDSPTSYVVQGLIDFLLSSHPMSGVIRDHVVIKIIPMVNPDGVFIGNQRTSLMGYDLNRHWNQISPYAHPVLHALKNYFQELDRDKTIELDMIFDLHADTGLLGTFIYGNSYEDVYRFERHILFPKLLAHNTEDYNVNYTMYNRDPHKAATARRYLCDNLRSGVNIYTLQISIYGYIQQVNGVSHTVPYNEDSYFRLGRNLARTFAEYYRVTGIIPPKTYIAAMPTQLGPDEDAQKKRIVRRSRSRSKPRTLPKQKPEEPKEDEDGADATRVLKLSNHKAELSDSSSESIYDSGSENERFSNPGSLNQDFGETEEFILTEAVAESEDERMREQAVILASPQGLTSYKHQSEAPKRPTFTTFDFSALTTNKGQMLTNFEFASGSEKGRKVGGGGFLGKHSRKSTNKAESKFLISQPEEFPNSPFLTIIDFNQLIRMGEEQKRYETNPTTHQRRDKHNNVRTRRQRLRRVKGQRSVTTDGSGWDDTSSDSEGERQFLINYGQQSSMMQNSSVGVNHHKMNLNPREKRRRERRARQEEITERQLGNHVTFLIN